MRVKTVTVKGFRSIKDQTVEFDTLTAFVGRNGAGKSSMLQALRLFMEPERQADEHDFYGAYQQGCRIEINVTFADLTPEELDRFAKYTKLGTLTVTRRFDAPGKGGYFGHTDMVPEFRNILAIESKTELRQRFNELVESGTFEGLQKVKSAPEAKTQADAWQVAHPDRCVPAEVGTHFYGFEGQYDLDNSTKFVFIPAVRDAADEISSGSLKSLMDTIVLRKVNDNPRVMKFNQQFQEEADSIFKLDNFPELKDLARDLTKTLRRFSPGSAIAIDWGKFTPPPLKPPAYNTNLVEDGYSAHPSKTGHGLQRAAIVTLLQHLHLFARPTADGAPAPSKESASGVRTDLVFLIEEPELYLHPTRARYLSSLLLGLVQNPEGMGRNQVVYSTHSPYFVGLDHFKQVRLMRKVSPPETGRPPTSICSSYSLLDAGKRLCKTCEIPSGTDPEAAFKARCRPVLNSIVSEGFFANAVLVVEGTTEQGLFPALADILQCRWDERGIVVVPAGGKNNLDRPVIIFEGFRIPTFFVLDCDADSTGVDRDKVGEKNEKLQAELGCVKTPESFPKTYVNERCACFEYDIEKYIRDELGDEPFFRLRDAVAVYLGYSSDQKVKKLLKNPEAASLFTRKVYDSGLKLPVLERIVQKVTSLAAPREAEVAEVRGA